MLRQSHAERNVPASPDWQGAPVKTKRTRRSAEIIVETDEIVLLKGSPRAIRLHCPACRREVSMISPEQAARFGLVRHRPKRRGDPEFG